MSTALRMGNTNNQILTRIGEAVSRMFRSPRPYVIVAGCDARVKLLVTGLASAGKEVSLIKPATSATAQVKAPPGVRVIHSTALGVVALERAGAKAAHCLVAATPDDDLNLSLCREARDRFGVPMVIARLKLLEEVTNWARLSESGMTKLTWSETVRVVLGETTPSASLLHLAEVSDRDQIVDLEMLSPVFIGRKIANLPLGECEVAALTRKDVPLPAFDSVELSLGDVLTLIGERSALSRVRETLATL
jgi:Trk K+ transport system NAD-binding subunit